MFSRGESSSSPGSRVTFFDLQFPITLLQALMFGDLGSRHLKGIILGPGLLAWQVTLFFLLVLLCRIESRLPDVSAAPASFFTR